MFDNLKILSQIDGFSGREEKVREKITELVKPFAEKITVDNLGNLIVYKKGEKRAKNKLLICAHMDQPCLMVTGATPEGYLRTAKVGELDNALLAGKQYLIGDSKIPAVIGCPPVHLTEKENRRKPLKTTELLLDIGARDEKEALSSVFPGDRVSFMSEAGDFGENLFKGKSLDSRSGCAIAIEMIKSTLLYDTVFVFTVQSQIGNAGAACASFATKPDYAIVLQVVPANDIPSVGAEKQISALCKGVVISFKDNGAIYDSQAALLAINVCKEKGICHQIKTQNTDAGDAGKVQRSANGVRVVPLGLACRHHGSPSELISKSDMQAVKDICTLLAEKISSGDAL